MRRLTVILAALPAIASGQNPGPPRATLSSRASIIRIRRGVSSGVSREGKLVYEKGYGMADLERDVPVTPTVVSDRRPGSLVMRPVYIDAFRGGIGIPEFSRDASGRVTGFVVNAGRVRALRFDRIE